MTVPEQISAAASTEAMEQESSVGGAKQNTQGVSGSVVTNLLQPVICLLDKLRKHFTEWNFIQ